MGKAVGNRRYDLGGLVVRFGGVKDGTKQGWRL